MSVSVKELHPLFFGEVSGIDVKSADEAAIAAVEGALDQNAVVVLHDQVLSDDEQIAFSEKMGELSYALNHGRKPGQNTRLRAEFYDISNLDEDHEILAETDRRRSWRDGDRLWHTDRSFIAADTTYSLLSGRIVPPVGGNTDFADMRAAYDALPEARKAALEGLTCEHSVWYSRALAGGINFRDDEIRTMPPVPQPLVRVHPRTGRKSLVLASHASHIIGWPQAEGRALLDELLDFATQPRFVYSHQWRVGDLVIWDNRCTMHRGTPFDDRTYRRDMRRTTVQGTPAAMAIAS